jgi:hypothetical protein
MAERFALIPNQFMGFDQVLSEVRQGSAALMTRKMKNVGPDGEQLLTGCNCLDGGRPAGMWAGAQARTHGRAGAGEGKAKASAGGRGNGF